MMFALAGMRFHVMAELILIKRKIDKLLDVYQEHKDEPETVARIEEALRQKRKELADWNREHAGN